MIRQRLLPLLLGVWACTQPAAADFSFSADREQHAAEAAAKSRRIEELVSVSCRDSVKNKKIMTLIAEQTSNGYATSQDRYGPHFQAINLRLRALGLRTFTQEEIKAQIAQAEVDAYFKSDPDKALSASKRLAADYVLRGVISTQTGVNPTLGINEVAVNLGFTLTSAGGRILSDVGAHAESFAGRDVLGMALNLVNEQADELIAHLYNDYCRAAGNP